VVDEPGPDRGDGFLLVLAQPVLHRPFQLEVEAAPGGLHPVDRGLSQISHPDPLDRDLLRR